MRYSNGVACRLDRFLRLFRPVRIAINDFPSWAGFLKTRLFPFAEQLHRPTAQHVRQHK
jgi:hypothetical protein